MKTKIAPKPAKIQAVKQAPAKPRPAELVFKTERGNAATDSLRIANGFGKIHGDVLRAIDRLECEADFYRNNFVAITYVDSRSRTQRKVAMTRDGFTFLVMGFTGKRAAGFKEDYIRQFNRLEAEISQRSRPMELAEHTERATQISNSKSVNTYNYLAGGIGSIIAHSQRSCELHTGKRPNVIVSQAKENGIPAKHRCSAKEVLRHTQPAIACAMSMADQLVTRGVPLEQAAAVTTQATSVFAGLLALGIGAHLLDPGAKAIQ